jgi:ketosteroid isomerase-like protein
MSRTLEIHQGENMPAHTPAEVHKLFTQYFTAGDIDALASLYEPTAVLLPQPGQHL